MTFYQYPDYMYHYGVKGMKWGVRKRTTTGNSTVNTAYSNMRSAKSAYKSAKKQYSKDFNRANNRRILPGSKDRWGKAADSAKKLSSAKTAYKSSKKAYKQSLDTRNRRYGQDARDIDSSVFGKKGERNINRKMNKGQSHTRAVITESAKAGGKASLAAMGVTALSVAGLAAATSPQARAAGKEMVGTLAELGKTASTLVGKDRKNIRYGL